MLAQTNCTVNYCRPSTIHEQQLDCGPEAGHACYWSANADARLSASSAPRSGADLMMSLMLRGERLHLCTSANIHAQGKLYRVVAGAGPKSGTLNMETDAVPGARAEGDEHSRSKGACLLG
jgi:hypothetical protein